MKHKIFIFLLILLLLVGLIGGYAIYRVATKDMVVHAKIFVENKRYSLGDNVVFYLKADTYSYDFNISGNYPMGNVGIGVFRIPAGMNVDDLGSRLNGTFLLRIEAENHGIVCFHWTNAMGNIRLSWNGTVINRTEGRYYDALSGYYFIYPIAYVQNGGHEVQFEFSKSSVFYYNSVNISIKNVNSSIYTNITSPYGGEGKIYERFYFENGEIKYVNKSINLSSNCKCTLIYESAHGIKNLVVVLSTSRGNFQKWWGK